MAAPCLQAPGWQTSDLQTRSPGARELAAYGLLALPLATAALPIYVHLPNLYGGLLGMNLALLGLVLLCARLADAFVDPLIGVLNDRLQRPRATIALGAALLAFGVLMAFNPPPQASLRDASGESLLWLWLAAALIPVYLGYSLATVSYLAWGALLGGTPHARTRVTATREAFGLAGVILASLLPALLAARIDAGLSRFSLGLAVVIAACVVITLLAAPRPPRVAAAQTSGLAAMLAPFSRRAFSGLFVIYMLNGIASALPATLVLFFVGDALQLPRDAGIFLAIYFVCGAAGLPLWVGISKRTGKPAAWLAAMLASVGAFMGALALGAGDYAGFAAVCALSGLALGADLALPPAMLADVIRDAGDETRAGAYFGAWSFATKLNLALAAGLALPLLEVSGYVPGNPSTVQPLYFAYCLLPCILKLAAAGALWKYAGSARPLQGTAA